MRERRYKTIIIDGRDVMSLFVKIRHASIKLEDVPEDFEIVGIFPDTLREAINVIIYHESFDIVPDCEYPPYIIKKLNRNDSWRDKGPML